MATYETTPVKREDLINYARSIRKELELTNILYFPVGKLTEYFTLIFPECSLEIVEDNELPKKEHAVTDINNKIIRIKESVYDGACAGSGRDRMTIMHEFAHYFLLVKNSFEVTQVHGKKTVAAYRDPEWQAKALAAELMIPYDLTKSMSANEIVKECGVSFDSAKMQKKNSHNKTY